MEHFKREGLRVAVFVATSVIVVEHSFYICLVTLSFSTTETSVLLFFEDCVQFYEAAGHLGFTCALCSII